MQIEIGRHYINKTWKYLRPCLKQYGSVFEAKYGSVFNLAVGIHDCLLDGTEYENQHLIYLLFDRKNNVKAYQSFMNWIVNQHYYVLDYSFDDTLEGRKQMVVLKIPVFFEEAYEAFKKGAYSQMYSSEQIAYFFKDKEDIIDILNRTSKAKENFKKKIFTSFGTTISETDLIGAELDFPVEKKKEFFNYRGE